MKTTKAWFLLAALMLGLVLVAAGCGGDDDEDEAAGTAAAGGERAAEQVITINWGAEPPSLDPGRASDTTSAAILLNIMDPLILLDDQNRPQPSLAQRWEVSEDGKTVTFHLRADGKWTNGDPVTAQDFEYSWKRTVSPELAADYAYQFYGIVGAQEYNGCDPKKANCARLRDRMGVNAANDRTLVVKLTAAQPWFIQQVAHTSFLAVHRPTVERFGERWTEAANIVTNGPFRLERWEHNSRIDLVKWNEWRDADSIALTRVNGRMISDATTSVQAYEAGEIDVNPNLPVEEIARIKETEDYDKYESLGTYMYGFNLKNIPDVNQRRAMSLAINRREIIDNITQEDQLPTTGFTPQGMPGFETLNPDSPWSPENGDLEQAKQLMERVQNPKRNINLLLNDSPGHREIAVAVQAAWKELGLTTTIRVQEWAQFLEFIGPPPDKSVDVFRYGWIGDYVDPINFLELWTCESGNNSTTFCNREYDRLVERARATEDNQARYEIYGQLEEILLGEDGVVPIAPVYWYTSSYQERPSIKETFNESPLGQVDLRDVEVRET
jgi:oligopeptide transport system substrate-binding protein